jgi:hypothetical protein
VTLKQAKFLEELPKNGFNVSKTARLVGYSEQSSNAGSQHRILRNLTLRTGTEAEQDKIKRDFEKAKRLAQKAGDLSNYNRANEALARINSMFTDTSKIINTNPDKIVIVHSDKDNKILP